MKLIAVSLSSGIYMVTVIAGNGKLVAVSLEGNIYVLGDADGRAKTEPTGLAADFGNEKVDGLNSKPAASARGSETLKPEASASGSGTWEADEIAFAKAKELISQGDPSGYAIWIGARDPSALNAIVQASKFEQMIVVDEDQNRIDELRRNWDAVMNSFAWP